ncbi:ABC transporter substrate-binding protein, partial [Porphyromonas somerae]|uniref:ABC transporter substrate-binding protein n=2 Tax=Porphyromonas TaxID=836 RepID=UPI002A763B1F
QAEWIKFIALLLDDEERAETIFNGIEERYNALKALIPEDIERPKVLSGELHGGNWYVVGGESYLAHQFTDAGAEYFMMDNEESGGFYVDFETVYAQGANADFWRILNSYPDKYSYEVLDKTDSRYRDFKAFKDKKVIYCNLSERPFYELSPVEPDVVLADLIKAFHPQLLPDHQPVFYEVLK